MLSVTPEARGKLEEVLTARGATSSYVRVGVVRGPHGCIHGWRLALEGMAGPEDTIVQAGDMRLLVESDLVKPLEGATIDYREDAMGIGFVIEAPNTPPPMHEQGGSCHH
ncbi:MAG: hypothetical protein HY686_07890 [Chloroflexi bacterium]|nr:hypothetical protein [Chloroflexota bacterium]